MPHIHTQPGQHDHTVTGFIVRIDTPEPKALVHMHRKFHKLIPPGGHEELLETPWQAMAHELLEESGYSLSELDILQPVSRIKSLTNAVLHPYPISMNTHLVPESNHFHSDTQYAFIAHGEPGHRVKEGESTDLRWLSREELNELDDASTNFTTRQIYNFIFNDAIVNWEQISAADFSA